MTAAMTATTWLPPPATLEVAAGEVHVWRLPLVQPAEAVEHLGRSLAADERARAQRFYFERDRRAFTVVRGALRTLLGRYLDQPADQLQLGYGAKGKPYLVAPAGDSLRFNVSHSGELALLAFTRDDEVGVDVELRRAIDDLTALADTSFSRHEYAAFCTLPREAHVEAFFDCWSRKEAFIKATGEGVSQLAEFDVNLRPGEPAAILAVRGDAARGRWSMHALPLLPGYAAALVVARPAISLACWSWPP